MHLFKTIKYQLYLLQLENYELGRYFKLLYKKGFWPKGEQRKQLVWTMKAKLLFAASLTFYIIFPVVFWICVFGGLSELRIKNYELGALLLTSYFLLLLGYFIIYCLCLLLIWPFDFIAKQIIIGRAKSKIKELSIKLDPGYFHSPENSGMTRQRLKIIGIAGSYGKTTMKEVLRQVLGIKYKAVSTPESVNTPVGISRWILKNLDASVEILIVEMGEHYEGDIREICDITKPDISVVTGINESHLERMGNMENVISTIFEVVSGTREGGMVVLNADDERVMSHYKEFVWPDHHIEKFLISNFKFQIFDTENLCWKGSLGDIKDIRVNLLGEYSLGDVDAAVTIAKSLGMSGEEIKKGIESIKPVQHRLQPIRSAGDILIIDDAYNGNPDGVREAIKVLSRFSSRRKVFITPGLVEMGTSTEKIHRQIGKELAGVVDVVVLIRNSVTGFIEEGIKSVTIQSEAKNPLSGDQEQNLVNDQGLRDPSTHSDFNAKKSELGRDDRPEVVWFNTAQEAHQSLSKILKPNDVVVFQNDWGDQYL